MVGGPWDWSWSISATTAATAAAVARTSRVVSTRVPAVDRQGHDAVADLLEGAGVGVVGGRLQPGDVAVAQAGRVLPEGEAGKLVLVEPQHDGLVARLVAEHGQRLAAPARPGMQLVEVAPARSSPARAAVDVVLAQALHGAAGRAG